MMLPKSTREEEEMPLDLLLSKGKIPIPTSTRRKVEPMLAKLVEHQTRVLEVRRTNPSSGSSFSLEI